MDYCYLESPIGQLLLATGSFGFQGVEPGLGLASRLLERDQVVLLVGQLDVGGLSLLGQRPAAFLQGIEFLEALVATLAKLAKPLAAHGQLSLD